ncbi:MAG: radical SAM protein [Prevotellaceae bacterium]|nr:radical SAM protein [Prevotellaceae bacterium]
MNYNCNLSCRHCRVLPKERVCKNMTYDFAINVINQLSGLDVPIVTFTGGEPTIFNKLIDLVEYTIQKGIKPRLQTNFTNIDKLFLDKFVNLGGRIISVSIDGLEETHNNTRGKDGLFQKIIALISKYSNVISFQADLVLSKRNQSEVYMLIDKLQTIGVKVFSFRSIVPVIEGDIIDNYDFSKEELFKIYKDIHKKTDKFEGIKIVSPDPLYNIFKIIDKNIIHDGTIMGGCSIGLGLLSIQPNGDVLSCTFINKPLGNLHKENLKNIIKKINDDEFIHNVLLRENIKKCSTCKYKYLCGGCRARALHFSDNILEEDPLCFIDML